MKKVAYIIFAGLFIFVFLEIVLRVSGLFRTYTEQNFGYYESPYGQIHKSHLFKFQPSEPLTYSQKEFTYTYQINNDGFNNPKNIVDCQPENTWVVLGDSFLFGVGAAEDNNMVSFLNEMVDNELYFYNAGKPDSDPFYQKKLVEEYFIPKGFKNFIFTVNISDIYDYIFRGGEERFRDNGTVVYRQAPTLEKLYKRFFTIRAFTYVFFNTDYTLLSKKKLIKEKKEAVDAYLQMFEQLNQKIFNNGGRLFVVFHPYPSQYQKEHKKVFQEVLNYSYIEDLYISLIELDVKSINLEPHFAEEINYQNYNRYAWKIDGHFKKDGYQLYAKLLLKKLKNKL